MPQNYYLFRSGRLKRKDNTLYLETRDRSESFQYRAKELYRKEKEIRAKELASQSIPVEQVKALYIYGEVDLNSRLLNFLNQHHIPAHIFNYYGYYAGTYYPREQIRSGQLLIDQVSHYSNMRQRLDLARQFVSAATFNLLKNLKYYNKPSKAKNCQASIDAIQNLQPGINSATTIEQLMGIEGGIRKAYFSAFNQILSLDHPLAQRVFHPPDIPINALISFSNSLVYAACLTEIYRTALNPTISFLHQPGERRFSLSLDLAEIFKPIIGDRLIFRLLGRRQLDESTHFCSTEDGCYLTEEGRRIFVAAFDQDLQQTISHPTLGRSVSYRKLIQLECYQLIKHLKGESEYQALNRWW